MDVGNRSPLSISTCAKENSCIAVVCSFVGKVLGGPAPSRSQGSAVRSRDPVHFSMKKGVINGSNK